MQFAFERELIWSKKKLSSLFNDFILRKIWERIKNYDAERDVVFFSDVHLEENLHEIRELVIIMLSLVRELLLLLIHLFYALVIWLKPHVTGFSLLFTYFILFWRFPDAKNG